MKGYVARKGGRWYAVIYEGLDPVTGKERRSWHPAGTSRNEAVKLADRLAAERNELMRDAGSLTFGAFLTERWLPGKRHVVAETTWNGYSSKIRCHVLPALGKVPIRGLKADQIDRLYESLLNPSGGKTPLSPKSVMEVHQVIRSALREAERLGIVSRNVALLAHPPRTRGVPRPERKAWTADELQTFLQAAAGHRLFPAFWLIANTGMRRNEVLGLQWDDFDPAKMTLSISRGIVDVGYEIRQTRGKTRRSRRVVDLDGTTVDLLKSWRTWRSAQAQAVRMTPSAWIFADYNGEPVHPQSVSQAFERIVNRADVPTITLHELRHTHATLLLKERVPVKVVTERLGHANPAYTIATYQHILPGMQADAAATFEALINPHTPAKAQVRTVEDSVEGRWKEARER